MRDLLSRSLIRAALGLLILGLAVALLALGAYVLNFAVPSGFRLAPTDGAWSNFGGYVGGVLGPLFSFLAFVAVLFTVWLQAKQLEESRSRAHLEELQRVLASVATNVDTLLARAPNPGATLANHKLTDHTVFAVLSAAGTAALLPKGEGSLETASVLKNSISLSTGPLLIELQQVVWCLQEYERSGGSPSVAEFYERRYSPIVCWLDALGLAESSVRVQEYFKPKAFRKFLVPAANASDV